MRLFVFLLSLNVIIRCQSSSEQRRVEKSTSSDKPQRYDYTIHGLLPPPPFPQISLTLPLSPSLPSPFPTTQQSPCFDEDSNPQPSAPKQSETSKARNAFDSSPSHCGDRAATPPGADFADTVYARSLVQLSRPNDRPLSPPSLVQTPLPVSILPLRTMPLNPSVAISVDLDFIQMKTFGFLLGAMWTMQSADERFGGIRLYIEQCFVGFQSGQYSVKRLCTDYPKVFECDAQDHLNKIHFQKFQFRGTIKLSDIPNSVIEISLERNQLSDIGDLNGLRGSSLRYLHVHKNKDLRLDLSPLEYHGEGGSDPLPLQILTVSETQISDYLHHRQMSADQWVQTSSLKMLRVLSGPYKFIRYHRNGSIDSHRDSNAQIRTDPEVKLYDFYPDQLPSDLLPDTESHDIFYCLFRMMDYVNSRDSRISEWMNFISSSLASNMCSVEYLCYRYRNIFSCNEQRHLFMINLRSCKMGGYFKLSAIPPTVTVLILADNHLDRIDDLQVLRRTSLRTLNLQRNQNLVIDVSVFQNDKDPLPLENLTLNLHQIMRYLGEELRLDGICPDERRQRIVKWVQASTLKELRIYESRSCLTIFYQDGTITIQKKAKNEDPEWHV